MERYFFMEKPQASKMTCSNFRKGFTLIEMLTVIAIIAILSAVVLVSTQSAMTQSRKASALTSAESVLPELVTCQDDEGEAITGATPVALNRICCEDTGCGSFVSGHSATWPEIRNGWNYSNAAGLVSDGTYSFLLTNDAGTDTITCSMAGNRCE